MSEIQKPCPQCGSQSTRELVDEIKALKKERARLKRDLKSSRHRISDLKKQKKKLLTPKKKTAAIPSSTFFKSK